MGWLWDGWDGYGMVMGRVGRSYIYNIIIYGTVNKLWDGYGTDKIFMGRLWDGDGTVRMTIGRLINIIFIFYRL